MESRWQNRNNAISWFFQRCVLLGIVWTFNMFNIIYLVTQDNPHTDILATFAFKAFFVRGEYGLACAYAVVILIILALFSLLYLKMSKDNQVST